MGVSNPHFQQRYVTWSSIILAQHGCLADTDTNTERQDADSCKSWKPACKSHISIEISILTKGFHCFTKRRFNYRFVHTNTTPTDYPTIQSTHARSGQSTPDPLINQFYYTFVESNQHFSTFNKRLSTLSTSVLLTVSLSNQNQFLVHVLLVQSTSVLLLVLLVQSRSVVLHVLLVQWTSVLLRAPVVHVVKLMLIGLRWQA